MLPGFNSCLCIFQCGKNIMGIVGDITQLNKKLIFSSKILTFIWGDEIETNSKGQWLNIWAVE